MTVHYETFTEVFLLKVSEHDFLRFPEEERQVIADRYMKSACAKFAEVCKYDIAHGDDLARQFTFEGASESEVDEILDIVSEGMLMYWMKPMMYKQENLELILNNVDYSAYSPAELTKQVKAVYTDCRKYFTDLINEYSYTHGDLTDLHL